MAMDVFWGEPPSLSSVLSSSPSPKYPKSSREAGCHAGPLCFDGILRDDDHFWDSGQCVGGVLGGQESKAEVCLPPPLRIAPFRSVMGNTSPSDRLRAYISVLAIVDLTVLMALLVRCIYLALPHFMLGRRHPLRPPAPSRFQQLSGDVRPREFPEDVFPDRVVLYQYRAGDNHKEAFL